MTYPFPGVFIEKGALKPSGREKIPVYVNGGASPDDILGRAFDLERDDETGAISFEMEFREGFSVGEDDGFSIYARITSELMKDETRHIIDATILGIQFMPFAGIPKAFAKNTGPIMKD